MSFSIFGKLTAAVLSALLFIAPVAPAAAWDEVCVRFAPGVGYAGYFNVIHGFAPRDDGKMPGRAVADGFMGTSELSPDEFLERARELQLELEHAAQVAEGAERTVEEYKSQSVNQWHIDVELSRANFQHGEMRRLRGELSAMTDSLFWIPNIIHNPPDVFTKDAPPARGVIRSAPVRSPDTGCVSIRGLPKGEPFYVLLYADRKPGSRHVLCGTAPFNPNWWSVNRASRRTQKLEYNARGSVFFPYCEHAKEY